ncbi:enth domain-containing protein [Moniliophthora roreri MCA 2997]|uniref:Enth domain-containing protein n=1 Tax=Moniliophthora roreri (strain MCA 2997) TaxID=1381753 RepID=V2XZ28_MONRO|nr:enth domain-containing protein [Moniliophthora roreri MCA 2997]
MSSYDKVVKLACKPKPAPPKAKYLDPIIAATWSEDGAVHDVCKALSPRFREPNAVVVFKALIVLHTMIRNGATDNVLSYLSSSEVLRLGNVSAGNWDGYAAPQNLQNYALYLDSRIRAYRDLKHDAIRVQAESNRDMRNSANLEEDNAYRGRGSITNKENTQGPTRSKTIMGRKLRVMTVEKGLLRETRAVHRMIDTLVECRFYLDDLEDELTTTALRMLVKDLLILFQAGNEGVINVLEHYFEMSHVDAEQALAIYRHFCQQTEKVVEYLGVAKKLQNLLNVPIPNLKHAPVSLAGALEEYLSDPNFEQNRIEYKTNKEASERAIRNGTKKIAKKDSSPAPPLPTSTSTSAASTSSATALTTSTTDANKQKEAIDFFATIEEEQSNMFNPQTNSPNVAYFQQNQASNPFTLRQMATGQPFGGMQPQATGFVMPQQTGFPGAPNPFASHLRPQPTAGGHRPFSSFLPQNNGLQPQQTGFLQPQATGANPFRQSMMMPQTTGMAMFGGMQGGQQQLSPSPFQNMAGNAFGSTPNTFSSFGQGQGQGMPAMGNVGQSQPQGPTAFSPSPSIGSGMTPFSQQTQAQNLNMPARPASTPLTSFGASSSSTGPSPPVAQPVKTHQTGTKNPFGPIATPPPPVPKQPTLMELAMGFGGNVGGQQQPAPPPQQQQQPAVTGANGFNFGSSALNPGRTDMSSVASSFSFSKSEPNGTTSPSSTTPASSAFSLLNSQNTSTTTTGSVSDSLFTSSTLSTQPTGASSPSISVSSPLKSQMTGFSGLKPFKPSSSFGASLMESLPPIPGSAPTSPAITGANPPSSTGLQPTGIVSTFSGSGSSGLGVLNAQPTSNFSSGSTLGQGLRPQMTGSNPAANPFRASMFSTGSGNTLGGGLDAGSAFPSSASFGSGTSSNLFGGSSGLSGLNGGSASSAGGSMFGGSAFGSFNHQQQQQQQYQQNTSLI